ncbi:MAG: GNAT family N-acetyltransferase [Proteobacteria bacterium]|nr:GNAT family N-acetyltransferase [Pseudomonadota bacterium]
MASNIVRELRGAGHGGHDLLGFASEIMQAVTDNGWDGCSETAGGPGASSSSPAGHLGRLEVTTDARRRPTIVGDSTLLRPPAEEDQPDLERWLEEPLVRASLIPVVLRFVIEHLADPAAPSDRVDLMVCDRNSSRPIGLVSLRDIDPVVGQAELGKMIGDPAFRGRGVAHEATRLILHYGFQCRDLNRIYLCTLGGSLKNIRLNERLGFRFEGVQQAAAMSSNTRADVVLMAMLRSEFLQSR